MPRRIDLGRAVLFAGAALLFVSLFLEWYDTGPTAWEVFETLDLVLAGLALAGIFLAVRPDATAAWAAVAVPAAALLIVFVQLVNSPPAAAGGDPSSGAWLALAGALLMAAGAALSLAAISVTIQVRERDLRRRMAAVDRRRASDDDLAEDLDADAEGPVSEREPRMPSLFGSLGRHHHAEPPGADEPPRRTGRFTPHEAAGEEEAAATAHRTAGASRAAEAGGSGTPSGSVPASGSSAARGGGDELERTQPMSSLPDEEEPERP